MAGRLGAGRLGVHGRPLPEGAPSLLPAALPRQGRLAQAEKIGRMPQPFGQLAVAPGRATELDGQQIMAR